MHYEVITRGHSIRGLWKVSESEYTRVYLSRDITVYQLETVLAYAIDGLEEYEYKKDKRVRPVFANTELVFKIPAKIMELAKRS